MQKAYENTCFSRFFVLYSLLYELRKRGGGVTMHTFLTIIFIIVSIVLTVLVLMQEGKSAGLSGTISGVADTYWGKNKGRSMEGRLVKYTKILAVLFFILAILVKMF